MYKSAEYNESAKMSTTSTINITYMYYEKA